MKIKITKIIKDAGENVFNNKSSWSKLCEIEGKGTAYVKTFTAQNHTKIVEGLEIEAEQKTSSKGTIWYNVYAKDFGDNQGFSKWSKPSYTKEEYNDLFKLALTKLSIDLKTISEDNRCKLFATYFIGAKDVGVKVEAKPPKASPQDMGYPPVDDVSGKDIDDPYQEEISQDIPF